MYLHIICTQSHLMTLSPTVSRRRPHLSERTVLAVVICNCRLVLVFECVASPAPAAAWLPTGRLLALCPGSLSCISVYLTIGIYYRRWRRHVATLYNSIRMSGSKNVCLLLQR